MLSLNATDLRLPALVFARALGLAWTAPGWGLAALGWRGRVVLGAVLTAALLPSATAAQGSNPLPPGIVALAFGALADFVVGASLGLAGALVVGGLRQAGEFVGLHAGLAPAGLLTTDRVDIGADDDEPLTAFGHLYGLIAIAAFLGLDGPLRLVDAMAASFQGMPAGFCAMRFGALEGDAYLQLFSDAGRALLFTARAAAPAGLALVFAGIVMAVLARGGRTSPLAGLAWPLRWLLGLTLVALALPGVLATAEIAWNVWLLTPAGLAGGG